MPSLSKLVDWATPCGIEHTWLVLDGRKRVITNQQLINARVSPAKDSVTDKDPWQPSKHEDFNHKGYLTGLRTNGILTADPQCLEHSSPVLHNWEIARKWFEFSCDIARRNNCRPFVYNNVAGGGHIHLGSLTKLTIRKLFRDMVGRPYVTWACIDPVDDINAQPLCSHTWAIKALMAGGGDELSSRSLILRYSHLYDTLEWRAFDSAADWEIQELQLALVHRWVQRVKRKKIKPVDPRWPGLQFEEWTLDRAVKCFRNWVVDELELPWRSYEWMIERNMEPRMVKQWGDLW